MKSDFLEDCKVRYAIAEKENDEVGKKLIIAMANAYLETLKYLKSTGIRAR